MDKGARFLAPFLIIIKYNIGVKNMKYSIKYIVIEISTGKVIYTIERKQDGILRDTDFNTVVQCIDSIINADFIDNKLIIDEKVPRLEVNNLKNTGGKIIKGINDLETHCLKNNKQEWLDFYNNADNDLRADEIAYASNKKVKVKCTHCGYERELMLNTFINAQEYACVACQSTYHSKCMTGVNDLYTFCKQNDMQYLLDEIDKNVDCTKIGHRSHLIVNWTCKYGHTWEASIDKRISGRGCPYCKGSQTSKTERAICNWLKENNISIIERGKIDGEEFDINITDHNILVEVNSDATHSSYEKIERDTRKLEIAKRHNKKLIVLMQSCFSDFDESLNYDIKFKSDTKDYLENLLSELSVILNKHGVHLDNTISNNAKALANKNEVPLERSLLGVYPDILDYWSDKNEVGPHLIFAKSRRYIHLVCNKHNNEYMVRADSLANTYKNSKGCLYCSGKLPVKGVNDLLTLEPELCLDWNDTDIRPDEVTLHSNKIVNWKCRLCGHEWKTMINNRTGKNKTGCPNCYNS